MFGSIAHLMYRRRWYVLGAWLVALIVAGILAAQAPALLGAPDYTFKASDSGRVATILDKTFHQNGLKTTLVILSSPTARVDDASFRSAVNTVVSRLRSDPALRVDGLDNPLVSHDSQSISRDRHAVALTFSSLLSENDMEKQVPHLRQITRVPGFSTRLTGYSVISYEQNQVTNKDLGRAEAITLPILLAVLILVFGTLAAAGIPFLVAIVSIVLCVAMVWGAAHFMSITTYVLNIISFIGLGIAIDYSLFIVYRFREELRASGNDVEASVVRTMETTGRAIFFSGLAVAVGLSSLLITGLPFMVAMGIGGMLIPVCTLLVTLTLLPALLGVLGPRINRFRVLPQRYLASGEAGVWRGLANSIMRRPVLAGGAVLVLMVGLSIPVTRLTFSQGTLKQAQGDTPGVTTLNYLRARFETAPDPYTIVIQRQAGKIIRSSQDLAAIQRFEQKLRRDPEVAQVVGPADLIRTVPPTPAQLSEATGRFLSPDGRTAIVTLVPKHDSTTAANMDALGRMRALAAQAAPSLPGARIIIGGSGAIQVDFDNAITDRLPLIALVVLGMTYVFLFAAFRTVFLPLKAVILNVLSVAAAFGMLELVFQEGYGVNLLGGTKTDGVPTWVLLFLFAFLFGLSMDYEVLLLSRIRESWLRTGNNAESVTDGLAKTGKLISSAALIMGIAFSGFLMGTGLWMKQMGLGLTVSIVVDATLIRVVLVPSIMELVGQWNWWVPSALVSWSRRGGVDHAEPELEPESAPVPA